MSLPRGSKSASRSEVMRLVLFLFSRFSETHACDTDRHVMNDSGSRFTCLDCSRKHVKPRLKNKRYSVRNLILLISNLRYSRLQVRTTRRKESCQHKLHQDLFVRTTNGETALHCGAFNNVPRKLARAMGASVRDDASRGRENIVMQLLALQTGLSDATSAH